MTKYYVEVDDAATTRWYKDPEMKIRHRVGGPAIDYVCGYKAWYIDGKSHREDGPAVELANGDVLYWLNNVCLSKEQWEQALRPAEELTIGQIESLLGKRIKVVKG